MVKITDADALSKMAQIEGGRWLEEQERPDRMYSPCHFHAIRKAYEDLCSQVPNERERDYGFVDAEGDIAIYGNGGWNRWFVKAGDGSIWFSKHHRRGQIDFDEVLCLGFQLW